MPCATRPGRMKRIVVIGSGGSGKSTFSRDLGEKTGIPVVHLDRLFWLAGWEKRPRDEWLSMLSRELEMDRWIMDGNFGSTREMRIRHADTVIFLDLPRYVCMCRILKRTLMYRRGQRPDMADGCDERFDPEFILWVWNFPNRGRKDLIDELGAFPEKNIITLKSRAEVDRFLREVA